MLARHIQHQAVAAGGAAAGVMGAGGTTIKAWRSTRRPGPDLEVQPPAQAEHQLRVLVAVGDQAVAVVAQREDRAGGHGVLAGQGQRYTPAGCAGRRDQSSSACH
jgi:hypothetical protein